MQAIRVIGSKRSTIAALAIAAAVLAGCSKSPSESAATNGDPAASHSTSVARALPDDATMRAMVDEVLDFTEKRYMKAEEHAAWQIVHGIMAFGRQLKISSGGKLVPALDYLLEGGTLKGWTLKHGDHGLDAVLEAGTKTGQGHEDQWMGYIAQCDIPWVQPITFQGKTYKFGDMITQAQWDIYDGMEASWTLIGLSSYLPMDAKWKAKDGSEWTLERIIAMESAQDLAESACGGSHRMVGITYALNRYLAEGGQLRGGWKAADDKVQSTIAACKQFQQPDGSLSTNYFERAATSPDVALRINTTGHQLEFLVMALTEAQLREPWVTRSVVHLCELLKQTRDLPIECGSLYHAAHGLVLYRLRLWPPTNPTNESAPAGESNTTASAAEAVTR